MEQLQAKNELLIAKAREEREKILSEARQMHDNFIEEAKIEANKEKERIIANAKESIEHERMAATTEIKNHIADISIKIAEKILEKKLDSDKEQLDYINTLLQDIEKKNNL